MNLLVPSTPCSRVSTPSAGLEIFNREEERLFNDDIPVDDKISSIMKELQESSDPIFRTSPLVNIHLPQFPLPETFTPHKTLNHSPFSPFR